MGEAWLRIYLVRDGHESGFEIKDTQEHTNIDLIFRRSPALRILVILRAVSTRRVHPTCPFGWSSFGPFRSRASLHYDVRSGFFIFVVLFQTTLLGPDCGELVVGRRLVDDRTPAGHDRRGGGDRQRRVTWRVRVIKSKLRELS